MWQEALRRLLVVLVSFFVGEDVANAHGNHHNTANDNTTTLTTNINGYNTSNSNDTSNSNNNNNNHLRQPRRIITIESHPARTVFGSVSAPEGSPWCQGRPMYWLVGHQSDAESPYCLTDDSAWVMNPLVVLDSNDILNNDQDGPKYIDRHDCTAVDANGDGINDLVCSVGADKGTGYGYHELYVTLPNGSLEKVLQGHGLHRYPTLRARFVQSLSDPWGNPLVFIATQGSRRQDNATNSHKLFRRVLLANETTTSTTTSTTTPPPSTGIASRTSSNSSSSSSSSSKFYFFEDAAEGSAAPSVYSEASVVLVADFNGDQLDDLLVGNRHDSALLYLQTGNGQFKKSSLVGWRRNNWRSAKLADFNGDGIADLIVSDWGGRPSTTTTNSSTITILRGMDTEPYIDCTNHGVLFEMTLPYATPDIAVLDTNHDGRWDLYVVQTDESTPGSYCGEGKFHSRMFWGRGNRPPNHYVPPLDEAPDLLLLGQSLSSNDQDTDTPLSFDIVTMDHAEPGCGFLVERFQPHSLLLAQGTRERPGHNLLLEW